MIGVRELQHELLAQQCDLRRRLPEVAEAASDGSCPAAGETQRVPDGYGGDAAALEASVPGRRHLIAVPCQSKLRAPNTDTVGRAVNTNDRGEHLMVD